MSKFNPEFQAIAGLATGLFLGMFSRGLVMIIIFIMAFEYFVWGYDVMKGNPINVMDRVIINLVFFFGWVLSRFLFLRETGCEEAIENCQYIYYTFPE